MSSRCLLSIFLFFVFESVFGQTAFKFAQVTDTHVGGQTGADDLRRTVKDLNLSTDLDFVILSGDVTEFGSDEELLLAKQILDSLRLPLYILPGNHDSNWSESGANSFRKIFGGESFFFEHKGYQFLGTTSGPNMRMSPGQIPRENIVWLDSVFTANSNTDIPLISINHYPLDTSLNNWFELTDRLHDRNVQMALCGHGHSNRQYTWDGIPGVMTRSNLRANDTVGAYNIVTIARDTAFFQIRKPLVSTEDYWLKLPLQKIDFSTQTYLRPNYELNKKSDSKVEWKYQDHSDLGSGMSSDGKLVFVGNTVGEIYALDIHTGKKVWTFRTNGKVYSSPAYYKGIVVVGSSDHNIYGIDAKTGLQKWVLKTNKAVLGSPTIEKGIAYIGGSDGFFRAVDVKNGQIKWTFDQLKNYVSTKPTLYKGKVIFGDWGNGFYALDQRNGKLLWQWDNGHTNRMFSAAACYPVAVGDRVFIVAPDRFMTCLDANTGEVIWREKKSDIRVRESMGVSKDGKLVYVKTMDGNLLGVSTTADKMDITWKSSLQLPYELTPSTITTSGSKILVPSHSGLFSVVDAHSGSVLWQYKLSNGMINPILVHKNKAFVSTMDGVLMKFNLK